MSLNDKLASKKFPHRDVRICVDGELSAEWSEAMATLVAAERDAERAKEGQGDSRLSGGAVGKARSVLAAVEERMQGALVTIRITAVPFGEYNKFLTQNPPRKGKNESFDPTTFYMFVARRTGQYVGDDGALEAISKEQWDAIEESMTDGDYDRIAQAVVAVNRSDSARGVDFLSSNSGTITSS